MKNKFVGITLVFLVALGFLFLANDVIYQTTLILFHLSLSFQRLLGILLGVFTLSFVAASILGSYQYNWFSRIYYYLSAIWMGFFAYLFFASFLYGLVLLFFHAPIIIFGRFLFILAFCVSIYGVIHARKIVVKRVSVALPNLPDIWRGRKAIWISDVHFGQIYNHVYAEKIVAMANASDADIIFIGGDLYDGSEVADIMKSTAPFAKFSAPLGTYFVTGNHEEFQNGKIFMNAIRAAGIHPLIDAMVEIDGLQIIGVDHQHASKRADFEKILSSLSLNSQKPSILLKHEPKDIDVAERAGISFQISGHTHRAQIWPLNYITDLIYRQFSYGLHSLKKMSVYTSSGIGTWGPPLRVGSDSELVVFTFV